MPASSIAPPKCYELAGKFALDYPEWTLVHGEYSLLPMVIAPNTGNAWVERDGFVFDATVDEARRRVAALERSATARMWRVA